VRHTGVAVLLSTLLLGTALLGTAAAASLTVDASGGGDYTTLQDAVNAADDGDRIEVAPGTYEGGVVVQGKALTITAAGSADDTFLIGDGVTPIITMTAIAGPAEVSGFSFDNPGAQGLVLEGVDVLIAGDVFDGLGDSETNGGAVYAVDSVVDVKACSFSYCEARRGGAIAAEGGDLVVRGSEFFANSAARDGGALALLGVDASTITNSEFRHNHTTTGDGGGVLASGGGSLDIEDTIFSGNKARGNNRAVGAIYVEDLEGVDFERNEMTANHAADGGACAVVRTDARLQDNTFSANRAKSNGGAAWANKSSWFDNGSVYEGNVSHSGGAVDLTATPPTFWACSFQANAASAGNGGAVVVETPGEDAVVDIFDCDFGGNYALDNGGALMISADDHGPMAVVVRESRMSGNTADTGTGGALYIDAGHLQIDHARFSDNSAPDGGGGLYCAKHCSATINYAMFSGNQTDRGGGAVNISTRTTSTITITDASFENNVGCWGGALEVEGRTKVEPPVKSPSTPASSAAG